MQSRRFGFIAEDESLSDSDNEDDFFEHAFQRAAPNRPPVIHGRERTAAAPAMVEPRGRRAVVAMPPSSARSRRPEADSSPSPSVSGSGSQSDSGSDSDSFQQEDMHSKVRDFMASQKPKPGLSRTASSSDISEAVMRRPEVSPPRRRVYDLQDKKRSAGGETAAPIVSQPTRSVLAGGGGKRTKTAGTVASAAGRTDASEELPPPLSSSSASSSSSPATSTSTSMLARPSSRAMSGADRLARVGTLMPAAERSDRSVSVEEKREHQRLRQRLMGRADDEIAADEAESSVNPPRRTAAQPPAKPAKATSAPVAVEEIVDEPASSTAPAGHTLFTHGNNSVRVVDAFLQTYTDHGPVWGATSHLYHVKLPLNHQQPPKTHHPLIMHIVSYVTLVIDVSYFPIPAARSLVRGKDKNGSHSNSNSSMESNGRRQAGPMGSVRFVVQCAPHYYNGHQDDMEYRCTITSPEHAKQVSPTQSVIRHNRVYFSAEVFANKGDILQLGRSEPEAAQVLYLDLQVGYQPPGSVGHDASSETTLFSQPSIFQDPPAESELSRYRLYWSAYVRAQYCHL